MKLFYPDAPHRSGAHKRLYAYSEFAYTVVDFSAALLFIIGSILFFNPKTVDTGTWLFLIGSVFFGMRPSIRLWREFRFLKMGDYEGVSKG